MRKIHWKTISHAVLEKIEEVGMGYLDVFFPPQYSFTRPSRKLLGLDNYPRKISIQTFRSIISKLKKQKLIVSIKTDKGLNWKITSSGEEWLAKRNSCLALNPDGIRRLIVFDIPEKERRKRHRVRTELLAYGFKPLQKSVWIGESPLPTDFLEVLDDLRLKNKVHIFSIKETGTLENS